MSFNFTSTSTPAAPAGTSGFSFGGSSTGGSSFGTAAPSSFGFGMSNTTTAPPATPSFGSFASIPAAASGNSSTAAPSLGTFGSSTSSTTAPPALGFGGAPTSSTAPATSFGGFSSSTNTTTPNAFGAPNATNPFSSFSNPSASTATTPAASTFSSNFGTGSTPFSSLASPTSAPPTANFAASGLFPSSTSSSMFQPQQQQQQSQPFVMGWQQQQQPQPPAPSFPRGPVIEALEKLQRSYAPVREATTGRYVAKAEGGICNDECNFKMIMLNKRQGNSSQKDQFVYGELLEQAERDNTDPENYIPVQELGIAALKARFDNQKKESTLIRERSGKISDLLIALRESNQQLNARFELLKKKQLTINKRVLAIVRKIEVLRCHGTPLQQSELIYRDRLLQMLQAVELPMKKLQDMSVNLALQEVPQDMYSEDINEEDLANLVAALKKQNEGIENLSEMLRKDVRDITIVKNSIGPKR